MCFIPGQKRDGMLSAEEVVGVDTSLTPPSPCVKLLRCPLPMGFIEVGFLKVVFGRNEPLTCGETLCLRQEAKPPGFIWRWDKIFLSNALGKQMSEAEIQIVFAHGNAVAKECINRYSLGGKFLAFK